jgi:DNA helicase HerA-like ATPase
MTKKQYQPDALDVTFDLCWKIPKFFIYDIWRYAFIVIKKLLKKDQVRHAFNVGITIPYDELPINKRELYHSNKDLSRHVLLLGGTGSGKSNLLTNYINFLANQNKYQFFILDPKGQTALDILENITIPKYSYYDLSDDNNLIGYNPLLIFKNDKKTIDRCLADIKSKIIPSIEDLKDTQVQANIFLKNILHFHRAYYEQLAIKYGQNKAIQIIKNKQLCITDIARLVESKNYRMKFQQLMLDTFINYDDTVYNYFNEELLDDKGRLTSEIERLCIHLSKECLNNDYETFLEAKGLNPIQDLQEGKSVIVNFNGTHKQVSTGMISLFFKQVYKEFKNQNKNNQRGNKKELIIIVEEAHALKLQKEELDEIIRMGRSLGIYLILVNQDIEGFDREIRSTIEEVIQTQISFNRGKKHSKDVVDNLNTGECIFYSPSNKKDNNNNPYKVKTKLFVPNKISQDIVKVQGVKPSQVYDIIKLKSNDIVKYFYE